LIIFEVQLFVQLQPEIFAGLLMLFVQPIAHLEEEKEKNTVDVVKK
jgi:hypothetical protein